MVSKPIRDGSGEPVKLDEQLGLEENTIQFNDGVAGMTAEVAGNADTETQGQAPEANPQSPEMATIVSAITTAYSNGQLTEKSVLEKLAGQLETRWRTIRKYDQGWRERSRSRNAAWMSTSEWVTDSEWTTRFTESDSTEIDCLRGVVVAGRSKWMRINLFGQG
ncbi:hypothetical protein Neosp_009683 [[Neocosmospora] mangrovei]